MIILLSPAKRLTEQGISEIGCVSQPSLINKSQELISILKGKSIDEVKILMNLSDDLSELNYNRYQNWSVNHNITNSKSAINLFFGDAYKSLDAKSLNKNNLKLLNRKLVILSGLYGMLKPFDLIQEHRLEMGTKLKNKLGNNLYDFWRYDVTDGLNKLISKETNPVVVNLASNEYFKVVDKKKLNSRIVDVSFKEHKAGEYKTVAIFAKKARGLLTRFIIENNIDKVENIIAFDSDGYIYSKELSKENEFVFIR